MGFEIGDIVGTYRILEELGSGAVGAVFKVEHVITKRVEAMKVVAPDASSTPEQDQRFLREIRLQAGLNHPNIAAVHNAFRENGHLVMIMELIVGDSLKTLLEAGKLPFAQSIQYACQALAALENAHAHGVVHRDISPANMIITRDGTLKLTDFGLAKSPTDVRLTEKGVMVGSLYYTSPEQVRGSDFVDTRSDIYSLGAVLYELTTSKKVFCSDNAFTLMLCHVGEAPEPPNTVNPKLPPALDTILLKALEKDPERRFQSAESFRHELEQFTPGQGWRATAPAPAAGRSWGSWRPLASAALPVTGALLFSAALAMIWRSGVFPGKHRLAARPAKSAVVTVQKPSPAVPASQTAQSKPELPAAPPPAALPSAALPRPSELASASRPKPHGHMLVAQPIQPPGAPLRDAGHAVAVIELPEPPAVSKPQNPSPISNRPGPAAASAPINPVLELRPSLSKTAPPNETDTAEEPPKKSRNPFRRALTWAGRPFHKTGDDHTSTPANSKDEQ